MTQSGKRRPTCIWVGTEGHGNRARSERKMDDFRESQQSIWSRKHWGFGRLEEPREWEEFGKAGEAPTPGPTAVAMSRAETAASPLQACHEMVPPETMQPVLRQIVDQFVHDRWQPIAHSTSLCACLKVWRGLHDNSTMSLPQDSCEWRQEIS